MSTLRYASRAKFIQNKPKVNEDPKDALLKEYMEEIKKLKLMLEGKMPVSMNSTASSHAAAGSQEIVYQDRVVYRDG